MLLYKSWMKPNFTMTFKISPKESNFLCGSYFILRWKIKINFDRVSFLNICQLWKKIVLCPLFALATMFARQSYNLALAARFLFFVFPPTTKDQSSWTSNLLFFTSRRPSAKSSTSSRVRRWRFTKRAEFTPGETCSPKQSSWRFIPPINRFYLLLLFQVPPAVMTSSLFVQVELDLQAPNRFWFFFPPSLFLPPTACKHKARAAAFTAGTRRRRSRRQSTEPRLVPTSSSWTVELSLCWAGRGGVGGGVGGGARAQQRCRH